MLAKKLKGYIRNTKFGQYLVHSYGDWRFPFMSCAWRITKFLVPRRTVKLEGLSFTLPCVNWITHFRWYLFKTKESEVRDFINEHLDEGDIFFDVGANIGVFSLYCAKRYSNISVYSFEPEYSNLNHLKDNVIFNDLADKITIHSVAIGDFIGLSYLNMQDVDSGAAAHTESKKAIKETEEGFPVVYREGISVITLDYFCDQAGVVPNALKIDTDGNELNVLKGAKKTLADKRLKSIVLERSPNPESRKTYSNILKSHGFEVVWSKIEKTRNEIWKKVSEDEK